MSGHDFGMAAGGAGAPLVTVVSASGGVGKSTIALLAAQLAARRGIHTALIEADLQFGDMGFWLGLGLGSPSLASGARSEAIPISHRLDLYKAPVLPELAEDVAEGVASLLPSICAGHELVIADTGQFWSGLTGALVCSASLVLLVMDQRDSSVYGAIKALELCQRLGVPAARIACVLNRSTGKSKGDLARIKDSLGTPELHCLADGKASVEALVGTGRAEELVECGNVPVTDVELLLSKALPRIGVDFAAETRKKQRRFFS